MAGLSLTYAIKSTPEILQAGGKASFTIIASASVRPVNLQTLTFTFKNGDSARDLIDNTDITPVLPSKEWKSTAASGGRIIITPPQTPYQVAQNGLAFRFDDVQINDKIGSAIIQVAETIEDSGNTINTSGQILVPKFPQSFVLNSFYSSDPIISQGQEISLYWEGQNLQLANYTLQYYDNGVVNNIPIPAGETNQDPHLKTSNANLYSYTISGLSATTDFYLLITAGNDSNNSFIRKSNEYLITVTPVIKEFSADVPYTLPGHSVNLSWSLAADSTKTARILCDQNNSIIDITTSTFGGTRTVTAPYAPVQTEYSLEVLDQNKSIVASRSIGVQVIAAIPNPIDDRCGYFVTSAQSADLGKIPKRPLDDNSVVRNVHLLFDSFKIYYPDITFHLDWQDEAVNAKSFWYYDKMHVVLSGGLVRCNCLFYQGYIFIIAQAIARITGKSSQTNPVDGLGLTYVGAADFHACNLVMMQVFYSSFDQLATGDLNVLDQVKKFFGYISEVNKAGDPKNIATSPSVSCRIQAVQNGLWGGNLPPCTKEIKTE